jgi:hypothetical protein
LMCENCKQAKSVSNVLERITSCFNEEINGRRRSNTNIATVSLWVRKQSLISLAPRRFGTLTLT